MEQKTGDMCGGDCRCGDERSRGCAGACGRCGCGSYGYGPSMHHIWRWAIAIAILAIVFKVGMAVGEFKTEMREFSGEKGMMRHRSLMIPGGFEGDAIPSFSNAAA